MANELLGQIAPPLSVSTWVQGHPVNFEQLLGNVVLVEVFQVNCPGCFLYSLPQAIELHQRYVEQGLIVLGVATAFEDFDKNTLENLQRLIESGEVAGETLRVLNDYGQLHDGRWQYPIPFPVAMDRLIKTGQEVHDSDVERFIRQRLPDFTKHTGHQQTQARQRVLQYLQGLEYRAESFERFKLQGTPSHILVDKQGVLRACRFGQYSELETDIQRFLAE